MAEFEEQELVGDEFAEEEALLEEEMDPEAGDFGEEAPVEEELLEEEEEPALEEIDEEAACVQEHLKDAVEGSLRLKRMLSNDTTEAPDGKRRRTAPATSPEHQAKMKQLIVKWKSTTDVVMKHVLEGCTLVQLNYLQSSNYMPNMFDLRKTPGELIKQHLLQRSEKELGGGSRIDVISAFKLRWKLALDAEKTLRALSHKDLRYVINTFDGSRPLAEVAQEAAESVNDEENTASSLPEGPGPLVMSRFNRLELIDPLADCAVFGDANLTFSMNLATHRKGFGHVGRVIATTFEQVDTLRQRYKEIDESIKMLEEHHAEVYHGVDCTRIAIDDRFAGMEGMLGAVYYNFPHSGAVQGFFDSHPMVNWRHENLMRLFFRALRTYVKPGGQVKVSSNSGAVGVRYSYIVGSALENEFLHTETMPFMEWHLHRYGRSYGDKRDTYKRPDAKNNQSYNAQNAHADMVYCFVYSPTGEALEPQKVSRPPTLDTLRGCKDGPFKNLGAGAGREKLAKTLHNRFLTEISGNHVG